MMSLQLKNILFFSLLLCFYVASYLGLQQHRTNHPATKDKPVSNMQMLPPVVLKVLAGEFRGLAADLMLVDIAARLGTEIVREDGEWYKVSKSHDWNIIHKLFQNCQALDPYFQQTFIVAQGWLPWDGKMVTEMDEILKVATNSRPWDWEPLRYRGFNSYYFDNDIGKAGTLYLQAAQVPNSPPFLSVVGGRLALEGGKTENAILLLENILKNSTLTTPEKRGIVDRYNALQGTLVIEKGIEIFRKEYDEIPTSPEMLVERRVLSSIPENPYNVPYCISKEGKVFFDDLNCKREKAQTKYHTN